MKKPHKVPRAPWSVCEPLGVEPEFDDSSPEVFDFVEQLLRDTESGRVFPLAHYLKHFPGHEEAISFEWHRRKLQGNLHVGDSLNLDSGGCIGPYRLDKEIGRGGQGVVYLARDTRIERRVALKLLPPEALLLSADRKARMRREAEVISRLDHPGICGIFDAEISGTLAYIAMHYIEGQTLAQGIADESRRRAVGEPVRDAGPPMFPTSEVELFALLEFFERAARALHAAHEVSVVHRDVKPANLMVTPLGEPVWLDFGQARDTSVQGEQLTLTGEVFGTPAYMSPEQLSGRGIALDPRLDVWALSVSLFEALCLVRPFQGASVQAVIFAVQTSEPISAAAINPAVTDELEVVLRTGLEKDLARRYASAGELADELGRICRYEPIEAREAGARLKFKRWRQRHPLLFVSMSSVGLVLALALVWTLYLLRLEGQALEHALGRHLAERATQVVEEDPAAALALGIEAVELAPGYQTRSALFAALERCFLAGEFDGDPARRFRDLALSRDGLRLAAALSDGSGRLYEVADQSLLASWPAHDGEATAVAISRDGQRVATAGEAGAVLVYSVSDGAELYRRDVGAGAIAQLAFGTACGDEESSGTESEVLLVSFAAGGHALVQEDSSLVQELSAAELAVLERYEFGASVRRSLASESAPEDTGPMAFTRTSDDGALVFEAAEREAQFRWQVRGVAFAPVVLAEPAAGEVLAAAFSPDGTRLAVASSRGGVGLFDAETGRKLALFEGLMQTVKLLWTPGGDFLIAQTRGSLAQVWLATPRPDVYRLFGGGGALLEAAFARDGERAVTLTADGRARVWATPGEASRAAPVGVLLSESRYPGGSATSASLSARGRYLVMIGEGGPLLVDLETGTETLLPAASGVQSATFLAGGERLLLRGSRVEIVSCSEPKPGTLVLGQGEAYLARLSSAAGRVVVARAGGWITCHDDSDGRELWRTRPRTTADADCIALCTSPDGSEVALASRDRTVRFLNLTDGSVSRDTLGVFLPRSLDWSADGSRLLVTGIRGRGAFMVKELASDQRMRVNVFHRDDITGGSFSPDGALVMTFSKDGTIFVRDVIDGGPVVQLEGDGQPIRRASFSSGPGTLRVIAACEDGSARIWHVFPLAGARARKPRELYEWEVAREIRLAKPLEYR